MSGGKNVGLRRKPIAHRLVQKDGDFVVRLLSDEHRLGQRERAEVHLEARVDARARDDRRNVAAARRRRTEIVDRARPRDARSRAEPRTAES